MRTLFLFPALCFFLLACGVEDGPAVEPATPLPDGPFDLWIAGGLVVDGTGTAPQMADLLVQGDQIVYLGPPLTQVPLAAERFDATGLVVTPGFIDAHAHGAPLESPDFRNFLAQGVTSILLGQDGGSFPAGEMADWLSRVDGARPSVNVGTLVGHNTIRTESGVGFTAANEAGRARMSALVGQAMDAGAFGLSTGLEYDPGSRADLEELVAIAVPVAARGGVVSSHMRNEDANAVEASLAELLEQGRRSGAAVNASHLKVVLGSDHAQATRLLEMMNHARSQGVRVSADVYPYTASFTGISILFPEWARPPHAYDSVVQARRDELAAHLRARVESRNGPEATLFGTGPWNGLTLAQAAEREGRPYPDLLVELGPSGARAAYFVMDENVMATLLHDPFTAVSSDGSPVMAHPRGYGSFARVLGHFVREEGSLTLEEAVRKMTGLTASIFGLDDPGRVALRRGRIEVGWAADLALFDLAQVRDLADFSEPYQLAEGMTLVLVNGRRAWEIDAPTPGAGHGRALRRLTTPDGD